jgi:hypothetical protein
MKRVGYLATSAFLDENHNLIILIVNTLQQDLKNDNYLVAGAYTHSLLSSTWALFMGQGVCVRMV